MSGIKTVNSITGQQLTAAAGEETVLLTLDGATPVAAISVPAGTNLVITDIMLGGPANTMWRLQQANDGATWFDIALFNITSSATISTPIHTFNTGLVINGGPLVAFRLRVETPFNIVAIATLRAYSES